ncbi:hypothetical protein [Pseudomonas phage COT4]|uniref:Uncharacterized protein n=1 Tax=Pseudomonas phage M5.1 TaxID=2873460 RepID=A0AAE9BNZ0_9CAUD|nr:hypothetical protein QGX13_gp113 [Pseudomonas phage M5.1]UAV89710.1 hypothetical protein M51_129 [Pseudomonas phage M5.1]UGL61310.1 hypothetical protein [Pseudomonas phage COT4]
MASVQKGTVVRVLANSVRQHAFKAGSIVTALGEDFGPSSKGVWSNFEDEDGYTQYLLPTHYEVVSTPKAAEPVKAPVLEEGEAGVVGEDLPNKVVYGVLNAEDEIYATTADRDFARELKAALGGKRKGVRIFQYAAVKEIR